MTTETRLDAGSIPDGGISVKALLKEAIGSAPVKIYRCGLVVSSDATVSERLELILRLVNSESEIVCPFRLCIGDVWDQTPKRSAARRELAQSLQAKLGSNYYDLIRRYAWVARMWPQDKRGGKRNWASYLRGPSGGAGKPRKQIIHEWVSREEIDGAEVLLCERADGSEYMVRVVKKAELQP